VASGGDEAAGDEASDAAAGDEAESDDAVVATDEEATASASSAPQG
jgi:hypothetical protein